MQNYQSNKYLNSKEQQESEQQLISWWVLIFGLAAGFGLYIGSAELARTAAILLVVVLIYTIKSWHQYDGFRIGYQRGLRKAKTHHAFMLAVRAGIKSSSELKELQKQYRISQLYTTRYLRAASNIDFAKAIRLMYIEYDLEEIGISMEDQFLKENRYTYTPTVDHNEEVIEEVQVTSKQYLQEKEAYRANEEAKRKPNYKRAQLISSGTPLEQVQTSTLSEG